MSGAAIGNLPSAASPVNNIDRRARNAGLTRGKGARQMCIPIGTHSLVASQHKSLALLASQSIRQMRLSRQPIADSSSTGGAPSCSRQLRQHQTGACPPNSDMSQCSYNSFSSAVAPPLNRAETLGMDEVSLHHLCTHISELLCGAPTPSAVCAGSRLPTIQPSSSSLPLFSDDDEEELDVASAAVPEVHERQTSDFRLSDVDVDAQLRAMEQFQEGSTHGEAFPIGQSPEFRLSSVDVGAQMKALQELEAQRSERRSIAHDPIVDQELPRTADELNDNNRIEVNPGEFLPLLGANETFNAIMYGRVAVTKCLECLRELTVAQEVTLVICSSCWVFSQVKDHAALEEEEEEDIPRMVGMGVMIEEIMQWLVPPEDLS